MHINESSARRIGGTVNVNLGRYRGTVGINLGRYGRFGDDAAPYVGPGSPGYDYNASAEASSGDATAYDIGTFYTNPAENTLITPGTPSPSQSPGSGSGYTYPAPAVSAPPTGPNSSWLSSLFGTTLATVPSIITAVKGNNPVVGGKPVQGAIYSNPLGNMGIIVPVVIGAVVLVGAALVMKKRTPAMAGYGRRHKRRIRR